jgi:hypothetical protein
MSTSSSDPDVIMHPAYPAPDDNQDTTHGVGAGRKSGSQMNEPAFFPNAQEPPKAKAPSFDLLERIPKMYRLLDLRNDDGSGGIGR